MPSVKWLQASWFFSIPQLFKKAPTCERGVVNYDEPLITGTAKAGVISGRLASVRY